MANPIPIVDLFAGPGGLGEGFSAHTVDAQRPFRIALSIEKDPWAHRTLTLRAFYRWFLHESKPVPEAYYEYLNTPYKTRNRAALFEQHPEAAQAAKDEARRATLGKTPADEVDSKISRALRKSDHWILIGGPPCQAYSLVGRSKIVGTMTNELLKKEVLKGLTEEALLAKRKAAREQAEEDFDSDKRHTLYQEYLRIIAKHAPSVFVMENVRGILSSKKNGNRIFPRILSDLRHPYDVAHEYWPKKWFRNNQYKVYSFVTGVEPGKDSEDDFLIRSENYGIPQARHRVILLGVRADIADQLVGEQVPCLDDLGPYSETLVRDVLHELPRLRSGLSTGGDTLKRWKSALRLVESAKWPHRQDIGVRTRIQDALSELLQSELRREDDTPGVYLCEPRLREWFFDSRLTCLPNHETRSHMPTDLRRYLFVSAFGAEHDRSPKLADFPTRLLPKHNNVDRDDVANAAFSDRFRVQTWDHPSTTVTSHIAKDGHYFIHPDPSQCRSLTVREAARLQTFPDNYLFEGPRTQQYHQVGNAVPPLLARLLAKIVHQIMEVPCA